MKMEDRHYCTACWSGHYKNPHRSSAEQIRLRTDQLRMSDGSGFRLTTKTKTQGQLDSFPQLGLHAKTKIKGPSAQPKLLHAGVALVSSSLRGALRRERWTNLPPPNPHPPLIRILEAGFAEGADHRCGRTSCCAVGLPQDEPVTIARPAMEAGFLPNAITPDLIYWTSICRGGWV
jgi:hypothetical protein